MGIMSKLVTALRGAATEVGEDMVDRQSMRILDQEMRDAQNELDAAKSQLAVLMGERRGAARDAEALRKNIAEYENSAAGALDQGNETLALKIAEKIATDEAELAAKDEAVRQYDEAIATVKQSIKRSETDLGIMKRQVSVVKVTDTAQKVSAAAASRFSGSNSRMSSAKDSLQRIRERQQKRSDRQEAAAELAEEEAGGDLDREIREAGLKGAGGGASSVLDRIRARKGGGEA